jgi:hypothetical protein
MYTACVTGHTDIQKSLPENFRKYFGIWRCVWMNIFRALADPFRSYQHNISPFVANI